MMIEEYKDDRVVQEFDCREREPKSNLNNYNVPTNLDEITISEEEVKIWEVKYLYYLEYFIKRSFSSSNIIKRRFRDPQCGTRFTESKSNKE
jgi:hypothetical protein